LGMVSLFICWKCKIVTFHISLRNRRYKITLVDKQQSRSLKKRHMLTDRFHQIRKDELEDLFSKKNISVVWRKIVRDQLRRVDILDSFDFYDFNYNIDEKAQLLRTVILNGNYQPSQPLIY